MYCVLWGEGGGGAVPLLTLSRPTSVCFPPTAPVHIRQAGVRQQLLPEQGGDAVR